jgi:hypothetical protein
MILSNVNVGAGIANGSHATMHSLVPSSDRDREALKMDLERRAGGDVSTATIAFEDPPAFIVVSIDASRLAVPHGATWPANATADPADTARVLVPIGLDSGEKGDQDQDPGGGQRRRTPQSRPSCARPQLCCHHAQGAGNHH